MQATQLLPPLNDGLAKAGLPYRARLIPAADESVDDELALVMGCNTTPLSVQVGDGYAGFNEELSDQGKFSGVKSLAFFEDPTPAAVVPVVVDLLRRRL